MTNSLIKMRKARLLKNWPWCKMGNSIRESFWWWTYAYSECHLSRCSDAWTLSSDSQSLESIGKGDLIHLRFHYDRYITKRIFSTQTTANTKIPLFAHWRRLWPIRHNVRHSPVLWWINSWTSPLKKRLHRITISSPASLSIWLRTIIPLEVENMRSITRLMP